MKFSHGGTQYDLKRDGAYTCATAAISAAAGCHSKSRAWEWANTAIDCIADHDLRTKLRDTLNATRTNFPNTDGAQILLGEWRTMGAI